MKYINKKNNKEKLGTISAYEFMQLTDLGSPQRLKRGLQIGYGDWERERERERESESPLGKISVQLVFGLKSMDWESRAYSYSQA